MREIKFRAWKKNPGVMYYDVQECEGMYECATCFYDYLTDDRYTLMQYTGLKDKNGKEIYEGDIVYANSVYPDAVVEYSAPTFLLVTELGACDDFCWDEWERFTVIGNKFENPDLLTKQDD